MQKLTRGGDAWDDQDFFYRFFSFLVVGKKRTFIKHINVYFRKALWKIVNKLTKLAYAIAHIGTCMQFLVDILEHNEKEMFGISNLTPDV